MNFELSIMIKTTVVLAFGWIAATLLRRASSSTRHAIWVIALFNALLLPLGTLVLPSLTVPILREQEVVTTATPNFETSAATPYERGVHIPHSVAKTKVQVPSATFTLQRIVRAVWAAGFLLMLLRLVRATWSVRRLARQSTIIGDENWNALKNQLQRELSISRTVQIQTAGQMPPMTWGIRRHTILLPHYAGNWTEERRRVVLAHELAHVKRNDGVLQILVQVISSIYWFSPMVWYASHRLRIERERACDDQVLALGTKADTYAEHLLQIARGIDSGPSFATVSMAEPSQLETRLISILDSRTRRRRLSRLALISLLSIIGVMTASIAAVQVTALAAIPLPNFETPLRAPAWLGRPVAHPPQEPVLDAASVTGTVMRIGTNEPLPRARVILNSVSGDGNPLTVPSDDSGRFVISNVPPGRYQLMATREGFVRTAYGQRVAGGVGVTVNLVPRQMLNNVVLPMTPTGAISGRIRNRLGEPVANVAVHAQRYEYESGRQVLTLVQTVRANDLGEYRLYYLDPGQYVVSALPPTGIRVLAGESSDGMDFQTGSVQLLPGSQMPGGGAGASTLSRSGIFTAVEGLSAMGFVSSANTGETFLPVFFPGVTNSSAAKPITVKAGETFGAVDFTVSEVRAVRIRGQAVNGTTGQPLRGVSMVLLSEGAAAPGIPIDHYGKVSDTGAFDFEGIAPGSYVLVASTGSLPRGLPSIEEGFPGGAAIQRQGGRGGNPNAAATPRLAARLPLEVGNSDIDNMTLPLQQGFALSGKISVEGLSAAESAAMTAGLIIHLQSDPPDIVPENHPSQRVQTASTPATVSPDGTFFIAAVFSGTYQIGIFNAAKLPMNAYVKSARFNEKDVLNPRLVITELPRNNLEIVIGTNPATLEAVVTDDKQRPAPAVVVVLVPDASRARHFDLYRFAVTDDEGHTQIEGLPPGDYTAYLTEDAANGMWWDPDFVKAIGSGKPFQLTDGGKQRLDMKWTPAP